MQHKDIPDSQNHEPKGAASAPINTTYMATGTGTGAWRKVTDNDMSYSDKTKNLFGWNDIADSLYTSGSPRAIAANTRTQLTNNATNFQTDTSRLGSLWSTSTNSFTITDVNASYLIRVSFKATAAAAAGTPYVVRLEYQTSNGPTVILAHDTIIKGGGYVNNISFTDLVYAGAFVSGYPVTLYITTDTAVNMYDVGFVIERIYKES